MDETEKQYVVVTGNVLEGVTGVRGPYSFRDATEIAREGQHFDPRTSSFVFELEPPLDE